MTLFPLGGFIWLRLLSRLDLQATLQNDSTDEEPILKELELGSDETFMVAAADVYLGWAFIHLKLVPEMMQAMDDIKQLTTDTRATIVIMDSDVSLAAKTKKGRTFLVSQLLAFLDTQNQSEHLLRHAATDLVVAATWVRFEEFLGSFCL
jgi:hypothetical protein